MALFLTSTDRYRSVGTIRRCGMVETAKGLQPLVSPLSRPRCSLLPA
ncbi:hypothetical protein KCP73_13845 [Salmonella enterica subsp. enterica]|nr:hypothetical protein KCP73_13845 [Salmonella enterica subsp. enterica]